jgi:DNA-binding beta-propeller fold protein YncE
MGESHGPGWFVGRPAHRKVIGLALAASALLVVTASALAVTGDLSQPAGTAGCVSDLEFGAESCAHGRALHGPEGVAVSPDGKSIYVATHWSNAVARFNRNTATGWIAQPAGTAGCVSDFGTPPCAQGHALSGPAGVAVSRDGQSVYVASPGTYDGPLDAVARLNRNTTNGAISQPAGATGCVSETGWRGDCADGHALEAPAGVAVSPDGKSVYAATAESDAVVRFDRNPTTGAISQPAGRAGCVSETGAGPCADGHGLNSASGVAVSPDGKSVYVASMGGVARLVRNPTTGAISQPAGATGCVSETGAGLCADGHGLDEARSVTVSPDGESVYVVSAYWSAVARLNRNTTTGAISQPAGVAGCVSETGAGPCADGREFSGALSVAVSPDGKSVYVASLYSSAVVRLDRNTTTGAISQPAGVVGCVSETGAGPCADGHGLEGARSVAVSPGGKSVYVASFLDNAVARFNRAP